MSKASEPKDKGVKRRDFLKILGASGAAVGTIGCSPEKAGKLIPYLISPDQTVPGVSTYYATTCRECAAGCGVIAETRDGRTIKLEGNPAHPLNRGAICARGQSALQGLYNPDRLRTPLMKKAGGWEAISWNDALALVSQKLGEAKSRNVAGNALFINQHESGSFAEFVDQWLAAFGMKPHVSVDFEADQATLESNRRSYGVAWPRLSFADARLIVSFGADFLDGWGAAVPQQLDFADARANVATAPRFIYIGPRRSLTGLNADQWIACKPGTEHLIAQAVLGTMGRGGNVSIAQASQASGIGADVLGALAKEIGASRPSLVLSGVRTDNALDVALAVASINQAAGNVGKTILPAEPVTLFDGMSRYTDLADAVERMRGGSVPLVMVRGTNPAYYLPRAANFADAFAKVPFKVAFATQPDETAELCDLILPDLHALETWGDSQPIKGTLSLQQPTMDPVFEGTRGAGDVLLALAQKDPAAAARFPAKDYRAWLMARFVGGPAAFAAALPKGVTAGTIAARPTPAAAPAPARTASLDAAGGDFYLVTHPHALFGDGRGANKPWLQELPDPVAKILWSSWVEIHPETATRLGIERGDVVEVKTAHGSVKAPAYLYLGVRPDTVALALGQGHRAASPVPNWDPLHQNPVTNLQWGYGRYARNVGVNPFDVMTATADAAGGFVWTSTRASITKTADHELVPSTEGSARQHGRGIAQAISITDLLSGKAEEVPEATVPGDASHEYLPGLRAPVAADAQGELGAPTAADSGTHLGMYDPKNPLGMAKRRWAMTVDLARCTGCSACVTACYSENNIPTVGAAWQNASVYAVEKTGYNIVRGREMNWIRLERYFEGNLDAKFGEHFEGRFVPMMCQQCGNAPCEPVCPVFATYHSPDGLNVQVYNRCVGTRYCSNNCPYKVRYFNWFGYGEKDRRQYAFPEPLNWQLNPDVTVRSKGVMEKCSFCVQRIREAENRATLEHRELIPDEFTTACAASCPSRAITFGDAADERWSVTKLIEDRRAYHVFTELNTYPAVTYLKKVNHPTPATAANA
ncbi:MAG TPA: 4Fe-4S dicluster domain-containing protein [Gemmatimonadaceae bacterium]|nr:4Fe-4S dicluster domain-containing protein [Gemmatimonadaceae bacterium]